jgi:hypothetical protein
MYFAAISSADATVIGAVISGAVALLAWWSANKARNLEETIAQTNLKGILTK